MARKRISGLGSWRESAKTSTAWSMTPWSWLRAKSAASLWSPASSSRKFGSSSQRWRVLRPTSERRAASAMEDADASMGSALFCRAVKLGFPVSGPFCAIVRHWASVAGVGLGSVLTRLGYCSRRRQGASVSGVVVGCVRGNPPDRPIRIRGRRPEPGQR